MTEVLSLRRVRKSIGEGPARAEILKGITLSVLPGEFVAVMGSSGSGKSTLLNIAGLLDAPTSGEVELLGRPAASLDEAAAAELRCRSLGFIFQAFHLLPYLTAEENVMLAMSYARRPDPARAALLLERVGLGHRRHAYPATLSGGEKQRVAIARALANSPGLILADEPTGALDSRTGAQILQLLGELHQAGSAIVMITHDEAVARRAERVLRLRDGALE